jgi:predicted Zn finger-like uncharacterized protein
MEVTCDHCQAKLNVPEDKIPMNQVVRLNCPRCKNKITIDTTTNEAPADENKADTGEQFIEPRNGEEEQGEKYSYDDYSDDEDLTFFEEDVKLALVMPRDDEQAKVIKTAVEELGYKYIASSNTRDALGKLRFHQFDLILLSEGFDNQGLEGNSIINYLNHISISIRRKTFFALIGDHFKTMDDMMAFAMSVNMVINPNDIQKTRAVLKKGISDFQKFYKVFMDTLVEVGKA